MALQLFPDISKTTTLTDGTTYAYIWVPAKDGKPVFLLLHGFPSASYDWRRVIPLLQNEGYGIIAPDLLGYGDSDKPTEISAYSFKRMAGHIKELVEKEGLEKVVGVGHDWGAGLLSNLTVYHQSIFSHLVFTSVGYVPPGAFDMSAVNAITAQVLGYPCFGYWEFFNEDDAGSKLDQNPESLVHLLYPEYNVDWKETMGPYGAAKAFVEGGKKTGLPKWFSEEDARKRAEVFRKGGYTAPTNWYKSTIRGIDNSHSANLTDEDKKVSVPTLLVLGEEDYVCVPDFQKHSVPYLADHRIETVKAGHWIPLETPDEYVRLIKEFVVGQ